MQGLAALACVGVFAANRRFAELGLQSLQDGMRSASGLRLEITYDDFRAPVAFELGDQL